MLTLAFSKNFDFFHLNKPGEKEKLKEYDCVISLVRNPLDSISSIVAMQMEFNSSLNLEELIKSHIEEYCNFYSFSLDNKYMFINFYDIIKNIEAIINYISSFSGYKILNNNPKDIVKDIPSQKFLKSSKNSSIYNNARSIIIKSNLDECERLYKLSLDRCVQLDAI